MNRHWRILGFITLVMLVWTVPGTLADSPTEGRAGRAEVRYLEGMVDHHQMALDMAHDCLQKASLERLQRLCQIIIDAQSAEIELMQNWLLEWYNIDYRPVSMMEMDSGTDAMDHSSMGHGNTPHTDPPMMMGMMAGLNRLDGTDYEIAWLESMIDHHDDAIHMSERILHRAPEGHELLRALAQQIIDDQSAEIEVMEQMIVGLTE